ncbi:S8 family serine peptidase [Streptomyces sp. NBC_00102]|uniref:S8 family serine peptidase n=1 Tax=Streptomyces sp. NBC_00102 TaxID=2975652 RepID=UPI002251B645|nr:S8 family serine peptidase [Streptomyces sp. NBC_00102]MCX5400140.1 S8 family serine peptidase [Streptomyces sp. NBC_00102]
MTAEMSHAPTRGRSRGARRRRLVGALAATAAWSACFSGLAPSAVAQDVQAKQWYLDAMQAEEMWKVSTGKGITVAVIDTGVNPDTSSLRGQVLKGWDATEAEGDENDDYDGHGTTMAELIAGTGNGGGLKGLAPDAKIIPYRISDTEFQDNNHVNAHDSEDAIRAAADTDARIISMSFGSDFPADEEREAAKYALSKGKLFFAAAGNDGDGANAVQYPAAYDEVVAVSSADNKGTVAKTSQHGGFVDLASPGVNVPDWCDKTFQSYCDSGGTSAATAIASASAALVWSAHPDWTANQVLRVLFDTAARDWADDETSAYLGHGLIRPSMNLLKHKGDPGDPDISPLTGKSTSASASGSGSTASPAPAGSASPSASASASSQPPQGESGDDAVVAGSSEPDSGGNNLGLIACAVVAVVVVGAGAFYFLRRRRGAV